MKRRHFYVLSIGIAFAVGIGISLLVVGMVFGFPGIENGGQQPAQATDTATPPSSSDGPTTIRSPEPVSTPSPEVAISSWEADSDDGYYVEAGVNTWGAADSVSIEYQGEELERIASGETEVIASSDTGTPDPLPEGATLVAYAIQGDEKNELLRWDVEAGGASNV